MLGEERVQVVDNGFDLVITPDVRFVRIQLRATGRTRRAFGFMGLLLVITSLGTFAAEGLWFVAGLWGLPLGLLCSFVPLIDGPRMVARRYPRLLSPLRCVFTADAIEWHTVDDISLRLPWTTITRVIRSPEAYRIECADKNERRYLCRTTLTSAQDAQLAAYLDERLAAKAQEPA